MSTFSTRSSSKHRGARAMPFGTKHVGVNRSCDRNFRPANHNAAKVGARIFHTVCRRKLKLGEVDGGAPLEVVCDFG